MPIYKYIITAEIEIEAPNIVAAEREVHSKRLGGIKIIGEKYSTSSTLLPSQRKDEFVETRVSIGPHIISRIKKEI